MDKYNVVWETPSKDSSGSMPIGNGDIGLNLWVNPAGELVFYISKTDAWSENARLLKLGLVRVKLTPNLLDGESFRQTLRLENGEIEIIAGKGEDRKILRVWVDANRPVIHVDASGEKPFDMQAKLEIWRTRQRELKGQEANSARGLTRNDKGNYPIIVYPDTVVSNDKNQVIWYHRNEKSCYPVTLENQHLGELLDRYPDPLMHRTFGGCMKGKGLETVDGVTLKSSTASKSFVLSIHPLTAQTKTSGEWLKMLDREIAATESVGEEDALAAHRKWWKDFWGRSWINVSGGAIGQEISTNSLRLRIGACSDGANRFKGYISQVRVFNRALSEKEVADPEDANPGKGLVGDWLLRDPSDDAFTNGAIPDLPAKIVGNLRTTDHEGRKCVHFDGGGYLQIADSDKLDFTRGCTLEAWIAPDKQAGGGGRIIDKSKAGTANAYLLDTYPGNSLRMIVEAQTLIHDAKFEPGKWVNVIGTYDAAGARSCLYINGKLVAESKAGSDAFTVSRGYALQRWINACGGRGRYPIKFNGSIFTVDAQIGSEHFDGDYRRWGGMFWWQNTRLPYWSMLSSGDYDLMQSVFRMYNDVLPLCIDKTRIYYKHAGAFFPETMYFWGTNGNCDYGWGHPGPETINQYIRREWQGGIEITAMMLDYYDRTGDEIFLTETLLPIAKEVLTFYSEHYPREKDGKIRFEPAQALETWWKCVNPAPEVAGLHHIIGRLLAVAPGQVTGRQIKAWQKMLRDLPPIPMHEEGGKEFVTPAQEFDVHRNSENPELYAVFPYRIFGLAAGGLDIGLETWKRRLVKDSKGWRQDAIQAAYLGLAQDAAKDVSGNFSTWHSASRFPAFWGPNFDWIPDQDHGSVAMTALQSMLFQTKGDQILLLPAWPKQWNADFKLHATKNTTVECEVRNGKVRNLRVIPPSRRRDVKIHEPQ
ncbi:MAG: DUF5703 domain-containing protein [Planctomycetota bacterium]